MLFFRRRHDVQKSVLKKKEIRQLVANLVSPNKELSMDDWMARPLFACLSHLPVMRISYHHARAGKELT